MMLFEYTSHAICRSAQRGLSADEVEYVHAFGSRYHKGGALICFLRLRDVPFDDRRYDFVARLVGTALVFTADGKTLITTWRNRRNGLKLIRKKTTYRFPPVSFIE